MKTTLLLVAAVLLAACASSSSNNQNTSRAARPTESPAPTLSIPKDGDYSARGVVTKINLETGSVELDHEDIPGVMPPMLMEFFVTDKKMLKDIKVDDKVDFVLRYKHPAETIVSITKAK